jgi:urease accessory protein
MTDLPPARHLHRAGHWSGPVRDTLLLGYEERFLRRKLLHTAAGAHLLVDLAETVSLDHGDALVLADGGLVEVKAAPEPLLSVTGDLPRLAWHIGNRHTPCQIEDQRLLIRTDHVLEGMLRGLGAKVVHVTAPFTPEGGAYGHGRTMGHDHGPTPGHSHDHAHGRGHAHADHHTHSHHDHSHHHHDH